PQWTSRAAGPRRSPGAVRPRRTLGPGRAGLALRSCRARGTDAVERVPAAIAVDVLVEVLEAVGVAVPAGEAVGARRSRLTGRPRRSGRAGGARLSGRSGLARGPGLAGRSGLTRGPGRTGLSGRPLRARLALRARGARRAGDGARGDVGAHLRDLLAHRAQALGDAGLPAGDLGVDRLDRSAEEQRRLVAREELVATQGAAGEGLLHSQRRDALRRAGGPVVGRHVGEGEARARRAGHGVRAARGGVDAAQEPVDEQRGLVA